MNAQTILHNRSGRTTTLLVVLLVNALLSGCTPLRSPPDAMVEPSPALVELKGRYKRNYVFGVGDQVEIFVSRAPQVSRTVVIQPDGRITLPLIDPVQASGLTLEQLRARLTEHLSERFVDPEVSIIPVQVREPMVYVLGQVPRPGAVPFREAATALEALSRAGGMLASGSHRSVAVIRLGEDGIVRVHLIDKDAGMPGGQPGPYMAMLGTALEPEDILFVPERVGPQIARFVNEAINQPLQGFSSLFSPIIQYQTIELLDDSLNQNEAIQQALQDQQTQ